MLKKIKTMEDEKLNNFVIFPRHIHHDFLDGKLTPREFYILCFLRSGADPYSKIHISLEDIRNTLAIEGDINSINKVLISLKEKNFIFYENRRGKRGMFVIRLNEWVLPNKRIAYIPKRESVNGAEPEQTFEYTIEDMKKEKDEVLQSFSMNKRRSKTDLNNNDTDKDNNNDLSIGKTSSYTRIEDFKPRNDIEGRCLQIASELGEEHIDFILGNLKKHGIEVIESAYRKVVTDVRDGKSIRDKRAYFNSVISKITMKDVNSK